MLEIDPESRASTSELIELINSSAYQFTNTQVQHEKNLEKEVEESQKLQTNNNKEEHQMIVKLVEDLGKFKINPDFKTQQVIFFCKFFEILMY
jgi:hypothetical protein